MFAVINFSIADGRRPVIHNESAISNFGAFLEFRLVTSSDIRIICQVDLLSAVSNAYYVFGSDVGHALGEQGFTQLGVSNINVGQWRLLWSI
jgi:hypothetical protein